MLLYSSEGTVLRSRREKGVLEDLGTLLLPLGALVAVLGDLGALVSGLLQVNP